MFDQTVPHQPSSLCAATCDNVYVCADRWLAHCLTDRPAPTPSPSPSPSALQSANLMLEYRELMNTTPSTYPPDPGNDGPIVTELKYWHGTLSFTAGQREAMLKALRPQRGLVPQPCGETLRNGHSCNRTSDIQYFTSVDGPDTTAAGLNGWACEQHILSFLVRAIGEMPSGTNLTIERYP